MGGVKADVVRTDSLALVQQLGDGRVKFDLDSAIEEVVRAVRDYPQKSGSITLKIVVTPMGKGDGDRCVVSGCVTHKAPQKPAKDKVYFTTQANTLVRDDPRQQEFPGEEYKPKG